MEVKYLFKCRGFSWAIHRLSKRNCYGSARSLSEKEKISIGRLKAKVMAINLERNDVDYTGL